MGEQRYIQNTIFPSVKLSNTLLSTSTTLVQEEEEEELTWKAQKY